MKRAWLRFIQRRLNPSTLQAARDGRGRFWIIRHVGRRSGIVYETPVILAPVDEGFVCELTYGDRVQWYRNIVAAGECVVSRGGVDTHVVAIEPLSTGEGLEAFAPFERVVLRLLRRHEFRLLRTV